MLSMVSLSNGFNGGDGFHVDHIVPVWLGEYLGISVYEMGSVENMQVISSHDNNIYGKYSKGWSASREVVCVDNW